MNTLYSVTAYYPQFFIGDRPRAVECQLRIVEANGRHYLKTPFAMVDAYDDKDHLRQIGRGYYATAEDCEAYLAGEYPHWTTAQPISDRLNTLTANRGKWAGESALELETGMSALTGELYRFARGHRSFTAKQIAAAVKKITTKKLAAV